MCSPTRRATSSASSPPSDAPLRALSCWRSAGLPKEGKCPRSRRIEGPQMPTGAARRSGPPLQVTDWNGPAAGSRRERANGGGQRGPSRLEVHAAHAAVAARHGRSVLLRLVGDDRLGGEEERRDGGGVLQRGPGHLG